MPTLSPKQQRLASVPLFAFCTPDQLQQVERLTEEVDVRSGDRVCAQGGLGHEFFIIESGRVSVERDGREVTQLGAGSHFGELALLGAPLRNADVTALTDLRLIVIGVREFTSLLAQLPGLSVTLLRSLAQRMQSDS
jgi:CRP-like cAMP-binding protein